MLATLASKLDAPQSATSQGPWLQHYRLCACITEWTNHYLRRSFTGKSVAKQNSRWRYVCGLAVNFLVQESSLARRGQVWRGRAMIASLTSTS